MTVHEPLGFMACRKIRYQAAVPFAQAVAGDAFFDAIVPLGSTIVPFDLLSLKLAWDSQA